MPGIVGIIGDTPAEERDALVGAMLGVMRYEDFYRSGNYSVEEMGVCAGCVAQKNASGGRRIFLNEQRDVALILSGECFVDAKVRIDLRHMGHKLESDGDWLVHLYEEEDERFFQNLNGLFSGLLIDKRKRKVFLFNDRYGSERIYWHQDSNNTYFASEAKALLSILPELRELDRQGVAQFLAFGCTLGWKTLFRGINLLPGGSLWTFEYGKCNKQQYFDRQTWESLPALSAADFGSEFEETFKRVLPRYFETNSKLGISLTGGLDTRMIMACRPESVADPVCYTFTGGKRETLDDRIAQQVAKVGGLEHYLLRLGDDFFSDFASHADRTVLVTDGSFGIMGAHEIYLNKQARQLAPVRLTGVYGSEILRGVSTFKPTSLCSSLIDREFGQLMSTSLREFAADHAHPIAAAAFRNVPWNLFGTVAASRSQVVFRTPYLDNEIVALAFQAPESLRRSAHPALRVVQNNSKLLRAIPTDRRIECRDAGLLNRLKRSIFEASFKLDYLYNEGMPNWLLPFDPLLELIDSKINVFGHHKYLHYRSWFRRELAEYVESALVNARNRQMPFWDAAFLKSLASEHISGRKNYVSEINAVLTLEAVERLLLKGLDRGRPESDRFVISADRALVREQV
jgi:asparagine synthase (glutamine-hydrolysing)